MIWIVVFLFVSKQNLDIPLCNDIWLALIYNYFNLHQCDWLQIDTEHPQNGSGKLGLAESLSLCLYLFWYFCQDQTPSSPPPKKIPMNTHPDPVGKWIWNMVDYFMAHTFKLWWVGAYGGMCSCCNNTVPPKPI